MDGAYCRLFMPEDVVILANPTGCLNDMCINGCIRLLLSLIKPSDSDHFAIFSTHDLLRIQHDACDDSLWRGTRHTMFWSKDTWIIPIHRSSSPVGHWVLCIADFPHRELRLFDSLAEEKRWPADVQVRTYVPRCSQQTQSSWRRTLGDSTKGHILVIRLIYCTLYAPGRFNERTYISY